MFKSKKESPLERAQIAEREQHDLALSRNLLKLLRKATRPQVSRIQPKVLVFPTTENLRYFRVKYFPAMTNYYSLEVQVERVEITVFDVIYGKVNNLPVYDLSLEDMYSLCRYYPEFAEELSTIL